MLMTYSIFMKKNDVWIIQLRKGVFELAILLLLRKRPMYGYELTSQLNKVPLFVLAGGSIYPILKRMVNKEWITFYWEESESGPKRKYYQITEEGGHIISQRMDDYRKLFNALKLLEEGDDE